MKTTTLVALILALGGALHAAQWQEASSIKEILRQAGEETAAMPSLPAQVSGPEVLAYADPPMGFTSKTFKGTLKLAPDVNVILKAVKGGAIRLVDGPITVVYGKPGAKDFFTHQRSVSLTQEGLTAALPARSEEFRSFGDFSTTPAADERVMLKGSQATRQTRQYERQGTDSCTYTGFCYASGLNSKGELSYSYGFHTMCSGSRDVLHLVTEYETVKTIAVLSLPERRQVGEITGQPEPSSRVRTLRNLGSCH